MKLAIATVTIGNDYQRMAEITHPLIQKYADKCGADFIVWDQMGNFEKPHYVKLNLHSALDYYDRILFVDTDIIIRDDAPNLFEIVPEGELGIFEEGRFTDRKQMTLDFMKSIGYDSESWNEKYYNTGVMLVGKEHQPIFIPPHEERVHLGEQTYLNTMISFYKPKVFTLSYHFNRMTCMDKPTGEERFSSYFIHYAGINCVMDIDNQLRVMQEDLAVWERSKPDYYFKKHIAVIVEGGLGDQIDAEPAIRYMRDKMYKGDDIIIICDYPDVFPHLGLPIYKKTDTVPESGKYYVMYTMRNPEHESWQYMTHPIVHGVDFSSLQSLRMTLPIKDRQTQLGYNSPNEVIELMAQTDILNIRELVLVHPGRGWDSKTFPADVWQSYVDTLVDNGFKVAVIGKHISAEQGIVEIDTSRCINLINKLSVKQLITLISQATVLVTNDSAPLHIAGAFDTWIGLIATCKHPDRILPWRHGSLYYKVQCLERDGLYDDYNYQPTQVDSATIDKCTEERMRECLPDPSVILDFVQKCFKKSE